MYAIYLRTKNDVNGNPRRGWIIFSDDGRGIAFVNEGYRGIGALDLWAQENGTKRPVALTTVNVMPSEFRDHAKNAY